MPIISGHQFEHGSREYKVSLDFKDNEIVNSSLAIGVIAKQRPINSNEAWEDVEVIVKVDFEENCIILSNGESQLGKISLDIDISDDWDDPDADWKIINNSLIRDAAQPQITLETALENSIQAIPVDPVIGCILKSGISAVVGQVIRCERMHRDIRNTRQKVLSMVRCMVNQSISILSVSTVRAFRCAIFFGLA